MLKRIGSIRDANPDVLDCRSMGHAWFHKDDVPMADPMHTRRYEECKRCGCERWREIDFRYMVIVRRSTRYVDGYLLERGTSRVTRAEAVTTLYMKKEEPTHE